MGFKTEPLTDFTDEANLQLYRAALKEVRGHLGTDYPLIISGESVETGAWMESHNPADTSQLIGRSAQGGTNEADRALDAAWDAFPDWSGLAMEERADLLHALAEIMRRRRFELAAWMSFEAAKNYAEADADVAEAIDFLEYYAIQAIPLAEPFEKFPLPGEDATTRLRPLGAGVVISPWNFPLAIFTGMAVGPAVVGNTLVLKPSPDTPIVAHKFMECAGEAGFPPGVFNLVTGLDADIGDYLVDHHRTRFINFTGSLSTGVRINERASKVHPGQLWIKKVQLEMGGKDALIVDETADLDYAIRAAVASGFGFGGQKCSAMSRLIAVDEIYDDLVARFGTAASELTVGPAEENPDYSALINNRARDKSLSYIANGKDHARLVTGGEAGAPQGYFVEPTVFADVDPHSALGQEEIFGPVISVIRASDFDDALAIANDTPFGLTGGVISSEPERLQKARQEFEVGNLYLNRKITGAFVGAQPFGGLRLSGTTVKAGGPYYLRQYMAAKTVTERRL